MTEMFTRLLSMGWTALPVLAVVLAARFLLRRAPKRYTYFLWAVVAFRLLCPVTVSTPVGLVAPEDAQRQMEAVREAMREPARVPVPETNPQEYTPESETPPVMAAPRLPAPVRRTADPLTVLTAVWLGGMAAVLGYVLWSFLRLRRMVRTAVLREGNVWECDCIPTPFVLGLFRPKIYIPFRMGDLERTCVLAHEREHLRWRDHWVKALSLVILTVYWWHPGVWLCWVFLCRDMELRCDEAVLASLGDGIKAEYSRSLMSFALDRRFPAALAFGEHDAARRVKHVLNWKQAGPAAVFLALAAVLLVTAVCGTNASGGGSWIRNKEYPRSEYTYRIAKNYRSFLLYQERYDHGELTAREILCCGSFGDGPEDVPYRGCAGLQLVPREFQQGEKTLFTEVQWSASLNGGPEVSFGGIPSGIYGESGWMQRSLDLSEDTAIVVAAIAKPENTVNGFYLPEEGTEFSERTLKNDIVLVLRLRLSEEDEDVLLAAFEAEEQLNHASNMADTLAQQLYYAPRTPEAILELLGAKETLGRYTIEDSSNGYLSLLFYDCPVPMPDRETILWKYSMVLLALLDDYRETTWNWIDGGVRIREPNGGVWNTWSWLNAHGLGKSIQEYGKSPEDLRLLLGTLYPAYGGGTAASEAGEALYAMRDDIPILMEAVVQPTLGEVSWTVTEGGVLEIALTNPLIYPESALSSLASADGGEGIVSDLSCLLMALTRQDDVWAIRWLDGGAPVEFSYLQGGEMFMENAAAIWTEHRSGDTLSIRDCGRSAAGMTLLLDDLGIETLSGRIMLTAEDLWAVYNSHTLPEGVTHTADQLYALSAEETPDSLVDDLVCWDLWGIPGLADQYRQTLKDGELNLDFRTDGGDADALDLSTARNAVLLMKLRPEITSVHWTCPMAERTLDAGAMGAVIMLSSDSTVYRQPRSAEEVQRLLNFLNALDDRVFMEAIVGREIPRQTSFTDILGYDGYYWDTGEGWRFARNWYAVEEGRDPFLIAAAYGIDPPEAYQVDLDGDGMAEMVCNYVTGGDGHPGVTVYQRREDGVYEGYLSTKDLPGHNDWGMNSTGERYDDAAGRFVISYDAGDAGQREAVFTPAEALARMNWYLLSGN